MSSTPSSVSHFVLVHGAAHGAWCWYKIRCLLESTGHKVTCPDLRGSGIDPTDPDTITTFDEYNQPLDDILSTLPESERVILVGHSAGGLSVTSAIHNYPEKLHVVIFVGAAMYKNGFDTAQVAKNVTTALLKNENRVTASTLRSMEAEEETIYQRSPLEDRTLSAMLIRPFPKQAIRSAKFPDGKDADKVPRVYIRTLHDRYYSQEAQDEMIRKWPPSDVYKVDSDHFPMFSNPFEFFGLLLKAADQFKI